MGYVLGMLPDNGASDGERQKLIMPSISVFSLACFCIAAKSGTRKSSVVDCIAVVVDVVFGKYALVGNLRLGLLYALLYKHDTSTDMHKNMFDGRHSILIYTARV